MSKSNKTVMVVDDDSFVRDLLEEILTSNGYGVLTAEDGAIALGKYNESGGEGVDLIVSDVNMPNVTGLELIKKLRDSKASVPIIILTDSNDIQMAINALNSGATDYLLKDENIQDTILVSVGKVLEKQKIVEENIQLEMFNAELERIVMERTKELKDANERLRELDHMKSDFLSTVSHELRTPLTSVLGFAKISKKKLEEVVFPNSFTDDEGLSKKLDKTKRQVSENLGIIVSEGVRLTELINDVLDLAKLESGRVDWKMKPMSVVTLMDRALNSTASLFTDRPSVNIETNIEEGLPRIDGDEDKLLQVMINLLSNASKFTDEGAIKCQAITNGGYIRVSVEDSGRGIENSDLEKIFDKFSQSGDTLTDKPKGTGLGLSICRQIIERHGGKIWAESEIGKGATFIFIIPVAL